MPPICFQVERAMYLWRKGKLNEAKKLLEATIAGMEKVLGRDNSRILRTKLKYANLLLKTNDYALSTKLVDMPAAIEMISWFE